MKKWRTGLSASINGGCNSAGDFAPCRTPLFAHPDVLAQVDATDMGNKQKLSEKKADIISTRRKLQRDVGRFQAIKYFIDTKEETLPWSEVLFRDREVDSDSQNADCMEKCHHQKKLTCEEM